MTLNTPGIHNAMFINGVSRAGTNFGAKWDTVILNWELDNGKVDAKGSIALRDANMDSQIEHTNETVVADCQQNGVF